MFSKYAMTDREKCELEEYRGLGLTPRQIRAIIKEAAEMREYIDFLKTL